MARRIDPAHDLQSARAVARAALERVLSQIDTAEILTVRGSSDCYLDLRAEEGVSLDLSLEFGCGHLRVSAAPTLALVAADRAREQTERGGK